MTDPRHNWFDRRDYLKAVGAAASLPTLGSATTATSSDDAPPTSRSGTLAQTASTTSTAPRDDFDTVVNVAEMGADPTGSEPINPVLEEHGRGDDTLLYFPPGRYLMDRQFRFSGFTNYGIYGEDATIVPAPYHEFEGPEYRLFKLGTDYAPGDGLLFQGLTIDQQADATGVRTVQAQVSTRLRVRDIHIVGEHDTGTFGPGLFDVLDPDGWGVVERFRAPDGGAFTNDTPGSIDTGPTGIIVSPAHDGKLWFRDCELGGFPDNGLYDSIGAGRVIVEGGVYRNSNSASIRIGGDDSAIIGARVIVDENRPEDENQRGIRLDHGDNLLVKDVTVELVRPNGHAITLKGTGPVGGVESVRIVDSTVQIDNQPSHGIVVYDGAGPTDIVNTQVTINSAGNAILVSEGTRSSSGRVFCQDVTITGTASGTGGRNAIRCYRDNCEFRSIDVDQPGPNYRRAIELGGDNCTVAFASLEASHHPILNNADGTRVIGTFADSYDGYAAVKLYDGHRDVELVDNTLIGGLLDQGTQNLVTAGNET